MRHLTRFAHLGIAIALTSLFGLSPTALAESPSSLVIVAADAPADSAIADDDTEEEPNDDTAPEGKSAEASSDDKPDSSEAKVDSSSETSNKADEKSESVKSSDDQPSGEKANGKEDTKDKEKAKEKAKPHEVKRDKLKFEVKLDGYFVADHMHEVALNPEVWTSFKVVEAVPHGTKVNKGDVLVRFDDEKLNEEIEQGMLDQLISELALLEDEEEFPRLKRLQELAYENAKRNNEQTKADYKYYQETDRPNAVKMAKYSVDSSAQRLEAAREELDQLQQMYDADELTEETEEIVLRRQRFAVETAELFYELSKENSEYTLNVALPRRDEAMEQTLEQAELTYLQAKTAHEIGSTRRNYDMEKKRNTRQQSVERHGKLLADKGLMMLRAPADGYVYYGQCTDGKWTQIASLESKLKPHGSITPGTVLMTVVESNGLHVESSLDEKELPNFKSGLAATIVPAADADRELAGKISKLSAVPGASNKFSVALEFDQSQAPEWLVAGMTCDAKVVTYENDEALVIPTDMVQTDEDDSKQKYVLVIDPSHDKPQRREVKLGHKQGKIVEVLEGLAEGDKIVKETKNDKD